MPPKRVRHAEEYPESRKVARTAGATAAGELVRRRPQSILTMPTDVIDEVRNIAPHTLSFCLSPARTADWMPPPPRPSESLKVIEDAPHLYHAEEFGPLVETVAEQRRGLTTLPGWTRRACLGGPAVYFLLHCKSSFFSNGYYAQRYTRSADQRLRTSPCGRSVGVSALSASPPSKAFPSTLPSTDRALIFTHRLAILPATDFLPNNQGADIPAGIVNRVRLYVMCECSPSLTLLPEPHPISQR